MVDLQSLMGRGFLPTKIPAPFTTRPFAETVTSKFNSLPQDFTRPQKSKPLQHSQARVGIKRRLLSVPNPTTQFNLCLEIVNHWSDVEPLTKRTKLTMSAVRIAEDDAPRCLQPIFRQDDLPFIRLIKRSTAKYVLRTDVAKCYQSIYTHSIPWAIHGKEVAKKDHSGKHFGNLMDRWVRRGQDDQTMGIPIGPDTSFLIGELILNAIDLEIVSKLDFVSAFRYYDAFEFGFNSAQNAETALSGLRSILKEYELELNETEKTDILTMPMPIDSSWASKLRGYVIRKTELAQGTDLLTLFDLAFENARAFPSDHVLQYAVARFRVRDNTSFKVYPSNWIWLERFLIQCLTVETGTFLTVLEVLIQYHELGYDLNFDLIGDVLNRQLANQCVQGYSSEAAWSVWALIYFGIPVTESTAKELTNNTDSFVRLLAMDALHRGLIPSGLDTTNWMRLMDQESLYGPSWLFAYEANVKGWLPSNGSKDHVLSDPCFGFLKSNGVQFYDADKVPSSVPAGTEIDDDWIEPLIQDLVY